MAQIKISQLNTNCAIAEACEDDMIISNEDLFKQLKCLSKRVPSDILTIQTSILTNLFENDGMAYSDMYCKSFDHIYVNFRRRYDNVKLESFLERYKIICYNLADKFIQTKDNTVYKNIPDKIFIETLIDLGIIFVLLEFANTLSSYGNENRSSLVDKMNQTIFYKDGTVRYHKNKVDVGTAPKGLPPFYDRNYRYGCNCLCNSIFVITLFRILATNNRLGLSYDPNMLRNINAYSEKIGTPGHSFLAIQFDQTENITNSLYIECTADFKFGDIPIIDINDDELSLLILKNLNNFIKTSSILLIKYNDNMYNVPIDEIYINVIDDYLARQGSHAINDCLSIWPELMDSEIMIHYKIRFDTSLNNIDILILILNLFQKFPNAANIWENYYKSALDILHSINLLTEKLNYLRNILRRWKPHIKDTTNKAYHGLIIEQINRLLG